jgi:L-fuconolactonase
VIGYVRHLPWNLPVIGMLAEKFPELPIVVDHLGLPHAPVKFLATVSEGRPLPPPGPPDYGISPALLALGELRNVHFKLTGLNLEYLAAANVNAAELMRHFVAEFGAERVLCGTDIGQTQGPYARIASELRASLALLTAAERKTVLFDTAARVFGKHSAG